MNPKTSQSGVSLIELMVGMAIGLFILGATGSVYLASQQSYRTADTASRLQENGRMALRIIAEDLQMAGFMGNNINTSTVTSALGNATNDCANGWYINLDNMIEVSNNTVRYSSTCMSGRNYLDTTDLIAIKRAAMESILDLSNSGATHNGWTLLRTDLSRGELFLGGGPLVTGMTVTPGELITTDRRWLAHVYFIERTASTTVPNLRRLYLGSGPQLRLDDLVIPGVQDLQIQFGIDTDGDGAANSYVEPDTVGSATIVAARLWVLMQSETPEYDLDDSSSTYIYAARSYSPGDGSATDTTSDSKHRRRLLLSTTVALRN